MIAAAYARVSTPDQTAETQIARLRTLAVQMGLDLPGERVLVDDGITGRTMNRPQFERVRELVRGRVVDVVLTTKLDRLGRSARGVLEFFELAESSGVRVVCADQSIDTASPVGRFTRTILAAVAELEADMIADRTREAMAAFKAGTRTTRSGKSIGRPPRLTPQLLAEIRRLRESGLKWNEVALRAHVRATTARKWYSAANRRLGTSATEPPRVINGGA